MDPANPQTKKLALWSTFALGGLSFYWCITYTGPFRYLAELQLKWFGSYSPKLTLMVVMLGLIGIAALIKRLFQQPELPVARPLSGPSTPANTPNIVNTMNAAPAGFPWQQYTWLIAPLVFLGVGTWAYLNGIQAGDLRQLTASDFQNGGPSARILYADVKGYLAEKYIAQNNYQYIPMFAENNEAAPVQLLVGIDKGQEQTYLHEESDGSFTVRGVVDKGLPSDVAYTFEKNGIKLADSVWIVRTGRNPSKDKTFGSIMIILGIVTAGALHALREYRNRKSPAARPLRTLA